MSLFTGTADYYRRYRADVPDSVAQVLTETMTGREAPLRLLDVGTGTGFVIRALLDTSATPRFDDIIGVDPEPEMLAVAQDDLRPRVPAETSLTLQVGSAEEYVPPAGWQADLVTVCRAFHWFDGAAFLAHLDPFVAPDGVVSLFGDASAWSSQAPWKSLVREIVQEYLGPQRRAGGGEYRSPARPQREVLEDSPFSAVERVRVPIRRTRTAESIVGYLHSTSFAAPHHFGDRLEKFDAEVRRRLAALSDTDEFVDENAFEIALARRPT